MAGPQRSHENWYEKAEAQRPAGNDEAILRWNTCARILASNSQLQPRTGSQSSRSWSEPGLSQHPPHQPPEAPAPSWFNVEIPGRDNGIVRLTDGAAMTWTGPGTTYGVYPTNLEIYFSSPKP